MKHLLASEPPWLAGVVLLALVLACDSPPVALFPLARNSADLRWDSTLLGGWSPTYRIPAGDTTADDTTAAGDTAAIDTTTENDTRADFVVARAGYNRYAITYQGGDPSVMFSVYLVPLGETAFLDFFTSEADYRGALVEPAHLLVRIEPWRDTLWTGYADGARWETLLKGHGAPVVRDPQNSLLITVGTDSLRAFLEELVQDTTVNWHWTPYVRVAHGEEPRPIP